jgi:hypothetical protein
MHLNHRYHLAAFPMPSPKTIVQVDLVLSWVKGE